MKSRSCLRPILVISLLLLLSGCATSGSPAVVAPDLPPLTAKLETDCRDPGVPEIQTVDVAIAVIVATRIWAVCEKQKHHDSNAFYRNIRIKLRAPK